MQTQHLIIIAVGQQISVLIALLLFVGLGYWTGYRIVLINGRLESNNERPSIDGKTTIDLIQKIQAERICITWEYEGGCHVWRYWDSEEPYDKAYGTTIQEACEALETQRH